VLTVRITTILLRTTTAGLATAVVALVAGCSWIQPSNQSLADQPSQSSGSASAQSAQASAQPDWVKGLGPGITVIAPAATASGHNSPGAALHGDADAFNARKLRRACSYAPPSTQDQCRALAAKVPAGSTPYILSFAVGYVVIHGNKALVGSTGTFCEPNATPTCVKNHNPAAIFSTAKPFAVLWAESVAAGNSTANSYSLAPCIKVGRRWYVDETSGSA
jgi:hypothetical protein